MPLIGLLDRSDKHHEAAVKCAESISDPLVSVWPPIVEAMYLLADSWPAQKALWEILETRAILLLPLDETEIPRMKQLMAKYQDPETTKTFIHRRPDATPHGSPRRAARSAWRR